MAATVAVNFKAGGPEAILRVFKTINEAAAQTARERVRVAQQTATAESAAANKSAKDAIASARQAGQEKQRAARETTQANVRFALFQATQEKQASRDAARAKAKDAKDAATAQKSAAKDASDFQREMDRASARNFQTSLRDREKASRESSRKLAQENAAAERAANATRSSIGDATKRGFRTGFGAIAAVGALAGGAFGISTLVDAGKSQLELGERSAQLQNSSGRKIDFAKASKEVSNVVGVDAGDVMTGLENIAGKAGGEGIDQVKTKFVELAKVARGAKVSMADLGDVTATLINRGVKADKLVSVVESLVQQGKDGAVEFKDLASMLDASSGALGRFKMDSNDRVTTAGGLSQIARTYGKKSAAEATGSVEDLARDLGGKADLVQALTGGHVTGTKVIGGERHKIIGGGVEVGTDITRAQMRDINTLLPEILEKAFKSGNAGKVLGEGGIFTGNSTAIVAPLMQAFNKGIVQNGSGRFQLANEGDKPALSGRAAVEALLKQFETSTVGATDSVDAFNNVMSSDGAKLSTALNKLKNDLGDRLGPKLAELTPVIGKAAEAFATLVKTAIDHPWAAVATVIGGSIAKEFAGMGLSKLFDTVLSKVFPSMSVTAGVVNVSGGVPGAGGVAGAGGGLGKYGALAGTLGLGAAAFGAALYVGEEVVDPLLSKKGGFYDKQAAAGRREDGRPRDSKGRLLDLHPEVGALSAFQKEIGAAPGVSTATQGVKDALDVGKGRTDAGYGGQQFQAPSNQGFTGADGKPLKIDSGTLATAIVAGQNASADKIVAALAMANLQGPKAQVQ